MTWFDITLYILGVGSIAFAFFPFSPMTLKLYMPRRETMILIHRHRHLWWGIGLFLFAFLIGRVVVGAAVPGWGWAVVGGLVFLAFFYWSDYVPLTMHPPTVRKTLTRQEAEAMLKPDDEVLGLVVDGQARAYSRRELTRPHVVADEIGGQSLAVTYCIFCNTAVAFRRELGGIQLDLRPLTTFNNNIIYYDATNHNYIQQLDGKVVSGPDTGVALETLPVTITTWQAWKGLHPNTDFIHLPATALRDKLLSWRLDWLISLPGLTRRKGPWHPVKGPLDGRLPAMSRVVGVELGGQCCVYPLDLLRVQPVINDVVGNEPLAVFYNQKQDIVSVFSRRVDKQVLTFQPAPKAVDDDIVAVDAQTGGQWDITGLEHLDDGTTGRELQPLPHFGKLFWFSWSLFKAQTGIKQTAL